MRWIITARLALLCLLAPLVLGGCSTLRLAYGQAPHLAFWWLDSYTDFTEEQSPRVREAVGRWFAWHREAELPRYAQALDRLRADAAHDVTPALVCRHWQEVLGWRDAAVAQAVGPFAALALDLQPWQLDHLKRRFSKSNDEYRSEHLQDDPRERERTLVKRTVERAERLYGTLDEAQRRWVGERLAASPYDPQRAYAERQRRQQDVLRTLQGLAGQDIGIEPARAAMVAYFERLAHPPEETYRQYVARLTSFNCDFAAQLHNRTTPAQRKAAQNRLAGWAADLRAAHAAR